MKNKIQNISLTKINNEDKYIFISNKPEETILLGKKLGELLQENDLIIINGDLGAGKTCLVKGIAIGLNCKDNVSSPSFTIINEYNGKFPIFHFDLYRLNKPIEIADLGYEEYFLNPGVILIEWGNKILEYLPKQLLLIKILLDTKTLYSRKIILEPKGKRYKKMMENFQTIENIRN